MGDGIKEGTLLWEPSEAFKQGSVIASYMRWLATERGLEFADYEALWQWSVSDLEAFWVTIVDFFGVHFARRWERVLGKRTMPGAEWFLGAEISYAENVFRHASDDRPALLYQSETRPLTELSWADLRAQVASVAASLREMGGATG